MRQSLIKTFELCLNYALKRKHVKGYTGKDEQFMVFGYATFSTKLQIGKDVPVTREVGN